MSILRLSHVELRVPDLELATAYYCEVVGMIETGRDDSRVFLKCWDEHQHHSVVLTHEPTHGLNHLGFKVTDFTRAGGAGPGHHTHRESPADRPAAGADGVGALAGGTGVGTGGIEVALEATPAVPGENTSRVGFTAAAVELLRELWQVHGPLMFHQSGGCCDGSAPMCYPVGEYRVGQRDVLVGEIDLPEPIPAVRVWINGDQFELWKHTQLIIDVVPGRGGMFSLENGEGVRFLVRSRLFTDDEMREALATA